jgi:hypothetical protein
MSGGRHAGSMAAPNERVLMEVLPKSNSICVIYQGTQEQLRRAGVVDSFMEDKILKQRGGLKRDAGGIPFALRCTRKEWIAGDVRGLVGDGVTQVLRWPRSASQALTLPGVRELCPDGISRKQEDLPAAQPSGGMVERERCIGRWQRQVRWMQIENVIWPDWREVRSGFSSGIMPQGPIPA